MRLGRDEGERHRRRARLQPILEGGARRERGAARRRPEHAERPLAAGRVETGLRAEQAELREAADLPQLAAETLARAGAQLPGSDAQHRRRAQLHAQPARSSAMLVTLPPNPERLNSTRRTAPASPPEGVNPSSASGVA